MHDGLGRATTTTSSLEAEQGGPGCHITMGDSHVQARPERLCNLPNEPPPREVIDSSKDEKASLDHEDFPKQGRILKKLMKMKM
uniref:Uncharacterized protein n=1 Tax=Tanacetum cinerariifolium TaxID=118510 RepID=A0A699V810_TANCI|nr:hypothetical protein [Tanacetum cinerariifolium]